jgi:hypothetical protein
MQPARASTSQHVDEGGGDGKATIWLIVLDVEPGAFVGKSLELPARLGRQRPRAAEVLAFNPETWRHMVGAQGET